MSKLSYLKKSNYSAWCKCGWKGSHYNVQIALDGDYCPECQEKGGIDYSEAVKRELKSKKL